MDEHPAEVWTVVVCHGEVFEMLRHRLPHRSSRLSLPEVVRTHGVDRVRVHGQLVDGPCVGSRSPGSEDDPPSGRHVNWLGLFPSLSGSGVPYPPRFDPVRGPRRRV